MSAITSADGFHHLVYSISGTTHTVFLDGSAVSVNTNGTNVFSTFPNISNLLIGTAADLSFGYTGFIDDFKIFNRALGSTEVSTIYSTNAIPPFTPRIIDTLSTAAYNQMVYKGTTLQAGAFGVKLLLYSAKSNPVIQIKAGTGGTPTDFYAPTDGTTNITTGANGAGTGIVSFLNGAVGYVTKWYDQTGNGHHATAAGTTLPTFNTTTKVVDFGTTGYFSLADNSFPTGNSSYTYLYKQGILPNATGNIAYSGGTAGNALMELLIINNNGAGRVSDGWYATDGYNTSNVLQSNSIIAATYGGGGNNNGATGKLIYMNNNNIAFQYYNSGNGNRYQTSANCYLGYTQLGYTTYQSTMSYFYWMPYQLGSADRIILGNT
jgi:hypothetical protein